MEVSYGAMLIAKERSRQVEEEGWTPEHDTQHNNAELAQAAICYLTDYTEQGRGLFPQGGGCYGREPPWPWDEEDWKPTPNDYIRQLTKAGALIAAELDRLHRFNKSVDKLVKRAEKMPKGSFMNP